MTDLGLFEFAAAPRTGTTWILHAACTVGLKEGSKTLVHRPFEEKHNGKLRVSLVRHPCDWLASYFTTIHPGFIGVPCVDLFRQLPVYDFDNFIRQYLARIPGAVGKMFASYEADSFLRTEDFSLNFVELLAAYDVPWTERRKCLTIPTQNKGRKPVPEWNPALRKRTMEAEKEMMEHFCYG